MRDSTPALDALALTRSAAGARSAAIARAGSFSGLGLTAEIAGKGCSMQSGRRGFVMLATLTMVRALGLRGIYLQRRCTLADRPADHTCELAICLFRDHPHCCPVKLAGLAE